MLDPTDARLRDIINWLTIPARCGFYFSHADIDRIAGRRGRTGYPGSRFNAFEQVILTAALDNRVDELFRSVHEEMRAHLERYRTYDVPAMKPWIERAAASIQAWGEIETTWREHLDELGSGD